MFFAKPNDWFLFRCFYRNNNKQYFPFLSSSRMLMSLPINCLNGLKILLKWGTAVTLQEVGQLKLEKIATLRQYYF